MRILFVCLGNICRSPAAEAMMRTMRSRHPITVQSAAMGSWHVGEPPYGPMQEAAQKRGYPMSDLRARAVCDQDFYEFDMILAMDQSHFDGLMARAPSDATATIAKICDFATGAWHGKDVADPYYTRAFDTTLDHLENALAGVMDHLDRRAP